MQFQMSPCFNTLDKSAICLKARQMKGGRLEGRAVEGEERSYVLLSFSLPHSILHQLWATWLVNTGTKSVLGTFVSCSKFRGKTDGIN